MQDPALPESTSQERLDILVGRAPRPAPAAEVTTAEGAWSNQFAARSWCCSTSSVRNRSC